MLHRLGGAVLLFMSSCLSCAVSCRVLRAMWLPCRCRSAVSGGQGVLARALVSGRSVLHGGLGSV